MNVIIYLSLIFVSILILHKISYGICKNRIVESQRWDLNICCGRTDGGGVNADIMKHSELPNFVMLNSIYRLPFKDKEFKDVLCSHTIEHVEDPEMFFKELQRVGEKVTLVIPPLWDISAVLNFMEHKWIFLSFRKTHHTLPKFIKLPCSDIFQRRFTQIKNA